MFAQSGCRCPDSATDRETIRVRLTETVRQDRQQREGELTPDVGVDGPGPLEVPVLERPRVREQQEKDGKGIPLAVRFGRLKDERLLPVHTASGQGLPWPGADGTRCQTAR